MNPISLVLAFTARLRRRSLSRRTVLIQAYTPAGTPAVTLILGERA